MSRTYHAPPIIEAICEFRFTPSSTWDWAIPGLLYSEVRDEFPIRQERRNLERDPEDDHALRPGQIDRMRFVREDKSALLQVGTDLLTVHQLRPYPKWPTFKQLIERCLQHYCSVAEPSGIARIGLRYINRLAIPFETIKIEDFLVARPGLPSTLPSQCRMWFQRAELDYGEDAGRLILQSGSAGEDDTDFMLDLDFVSTKPLPAEAPRALEWLEQAHEKIEESFESCITDKTRELFQEAIDEKV